jgi:hypothetical protein
MGASEPDKLLSIEQLQQLTKRIEVLERQLAASNKPHADEGFKQQHQQQKKKELENAESDHGQHQKTGDEDTSEKIEESLTDIHKQVTTFINGPYMSSQKMLRERLMEQEWYKNAHTWALTKGIADFEKQCVDKDWHVDEQALVALRRKPEDLSVLQDPKHRMLAHAMQEAAVYDLRKEVYKHVSDEAKELAKLTQPGQQPAPFLQALWSAIKRFIPIPFFR